MDTLLHSLVGNISDNYVVEYDELVIKIKKVDSVNYNEKLSFYIFKTDVLGNTIEQPIIKAIGGTFKVLNDDTQQDYTEYNVPSISEELYSIGLILENKDYEIHIKNAKYAIGGLSTTSSNTQTDQYRSPVVVDFNNFEYCKLYNFTLINEQSNPSYEASGILSPKYPENTRIINIMSNNEAAASYFDFGVNVECFAGTKNITYFSMKNTTHSFGNIVNLAENKHMTTLNCRNCSEVTGDIDTFASAMAETRTSGTLNLDTRGSGITYNSVVANAVYNIVFDSSAPNGYTVSLA